MREQRRYAELRQPLWSVEVKERMESKHVKEHRSPVQHASVARSGLALANLSIQIIEQSHVDANFRSVRQLQVLPNDTSVWRLSLFDSCLGIDNAEGPWHR